MSNSIDLAAPPLEGDSSVIRDAARERKRARDAEYRAANREGRRARQAEYYAANRERERKRSAEYRAANAERVAAYQAEYHKANRERLAARKAEYQSANREHIAARRSARYTANRERVKAQKAAWLTINPDAVKTQGRNRRARKQSAEGAHTRADIARIAAAQKHRCAFCRTSIRKESHVDHIVPLSKGGTNWPRNLQILCPPCNLRKNAKDPIAFARENGMLL